MTKFKIYDIFQVQNCSMSWWHAVEETTLYSTACHQGILHYFCDYYVDGFEQVVNFLSKMSTLENFETRLPNIFLCLVPLLCSFKSRDKSTRQIIYRQAQEINQRKGSENPLLAIHRQRSFLKTLKPCPKKKIIVTDNWLASSKKSWLL